MPTFRNILESSRSKQPLNFLNNTANNQFKCRSLKSKASWLSSKAIFSRRSLRKAKAPPQWKGKKSRVLYVHNPALYRGTLTDGTEFDSNQDTSSPFKFTLGVGQVIKCWDQGFGTMKKGEKAILVCSPEFGYGKNGSGKIPPNATLHFEVELLSFQDKKREKYELTEAEKV